MPYGIVWRVLDGQVSMRGRLALLSPAMLPKALPTAASVAEPPVMYLSRVDVDGRQKQVVVVLGKGTGKISIRCREEAIDTRRYGIVPSLAIDRQTREMSHLGESLRRREEER